MTRFLIQTFCNEESPVLFFLMEKTKRINLIGQISNIFYHFISNSGFASMKTKTNVVHTPMDFYKFLHVLRSGFFYPHFSGSARHLYFRQSPFFLFLIILVSQLLFCLLDNMKTFTKILYVVFFSSLGYCIATIA